jgi:hypothetical protein
LLIILISLAVALSYSYLYQDFNTGFSIASYMVTCLELLVAVMAAADYIDMKSP